MIELSILIVCYNSRGLISQCLCGVHTYTKGVNYEVILLDCSNDGTLDFVRGAFPQTILVENSENLGYGKGNNLLAQHANGKFLLMLNPDVIIKDDAIGELYRTAIAMPQAGALAGRIRFPNGRRDPGCRQYIPTILRILIVALGGGRIINGTIPEAATKAAEVETLSGAFMLVRMDAWQEARGFDPSFFMYSEDLDLCYRLRKRGWGIVMTPHAEIIHLDAGGNGNTPTRIHLLTTARMHFFRKYWNPPSVCLAGAILWVHALIRVLIGTVASVFVNQSWPSRLRQMYIGIVAHPENWWYGFDGKKHRQM
jgi:GT2 family glycosyltransferase